MSIEPAENQTYRELLPPALLNAHVSFFWLQQVSEEGPSYEHRTVPHGCVEISASLPQGSIDVVGPQYGPRFDYLMPGAVVIGGRLRPGAAIILGITADELIDKRVPLEVVLGRAGARLAEQLAEQHTVQQAASLLSAALAHRAGDAPSPDPLVAKIVETLQPINAGRITDIARDLCLSPRQLRRRCLTALGFGPKTLQRLLRFQRFLALSQRRPGASLASLAIEAGYADQSHLTHESVELASLPPAKLVAETRANCGPTHDHSVSFAPFCAMPASNSRPG